MKRMKAVIAMAAVCAATVSVYAGKKREEKDSFLTAVASGDVAEIQRLIASSADVNAKESARFGRTALMRAAEEKSEDLVKMLIEAGADVNASDGDGRTALMIAAEEKSEDLVKMLIEAGADVNASDGDGRTALMLAVKENAEDLAKMLIEAGADMNASDGDGRAVFMYASYPVKQLLRKAGSQ